MNNYQNKSMCTGNYLSHLYSSFHLFLPLQTSSHTPHHTHTHPSSVHLYRLGWNVLGQTLTVFISRSWIKGDFHFLYFLYYQQNNVTFKKTHPVDTISRLHSLSDIDISLKLNVSLIALELFHISLRQRLGIYSRSVNI